MTDELFQTHTCPECQLDFQIQRGFLAWCPSCEWNIKQPDPDDSEPKSKWERFYLRLSKRNGQTLFTQISQLDSLFRVPLSRPALIGKILAWGIISLWISLLIAGFSLIVVYWEEWPMTISGGLCVGAFWFVRPRFPQFPAEKLTPRHDIPALYALCDKICEHLKIPPVDGIILNEHFNAAVAAYGWKNRRILYIGLPLWAILSAQEKLGILGHELGHLANGDPVRDRPLWFAICLIIESGELIYPETLLPDLYATQGWGDILTYPAKYLAVPLNLLLRGVSHLLWWIGYGFALLLWADSQRAEYLADLYGARLGATDAFISALTKTTYYETIQLQLQRFSVRPKAQRLQDDLFSELALAIEQLPEHEVERRKRLLEREEHYLDSSHPPTALRLAMLRQKRAFIYQHNLSIHADFTAITEQLKPFQAKMQAALIDAYWDKIL